MGRRAKQALFCNQTWGKGRVMYRIQKGESYSGCIPKTVWFVQKHINICCVYDGWVNIKGYDSYDKAKRLLHILNGKEKL